MALEGDFFARMTEISAKNHELTNKATIILKNVELRIREANPGIEVELVGPFYESDSVVDDIAGEVFKHKFTLAWIKHHGAGWSLGCHKSRWARPTSIASHDPNNPEFDQDGCCDMEDSSVLLIDSWPAAVRISALKHIEALSQKLLSAVEGQIEDRDEASELIDKYEELSGRVHKSGEIPF